MEHLQCQSLNLALYRDGYTHAVSQRRVCFLANHFLALLVISTMMSFTSFLLSAGRVKGSRQVKSSPLALHCMVRPSLHENTIHGR